MIKFVGSSELLIDPLPVAHVVVQLGGPLFSAPADSAMIPGILCYKYGLTSSGAAPRFFASLLIHINGVLVGWLYALSLINQTFPSHNPYSR